MSKISKLCEYCSEQYLSYEKQNKRFCSLKCKYDYKKIIVQCPFCLSDFQITRARKERLQGDHICCSIICRDKIREIIMECSHCNKKFKRPRANRRFCSVLCVTEHRKAANIPGKWMENGYNVIYAGGGQGIKEHIYLMEQHIGRKLKANEVVHHINEIRNDNRMCNLKLMTHGEHSRLHRELELAKGKKLFNAG